MSAKRKKFTADQWKTVAYLIDEAAVGIEAWGGDHPDEKREATHAVRLLKNLADRVARRGLRTLNEINV